MADRLDIDVGDVADPFGTIPEGNYELQVVKLERTKSKASGNDMLAIQYEVQGGEYAGRKLFDNAVLEGSGSQFGLWRLKQLLFAANEPYSGYDLSNVVGTDVDAQVTIEDGERGEQNRVTLLIEPA